MKATLIGDYPDFAAASRAAADLMKAGFAQAELSVVGREKLDDGARFAFAGALAGALCGAHEHDFGSRLARGLAELCVPPRAALRHASAMADGGGLVALRIDDERARKAEAVMLRHGVTERYASGPLPFERSERSRSCVA